MQVALVCNYVPGIMRHERQLLCVFLRQKEESGAGVKRCTGECLGDVSIRSRVFLVD